MSKIPFFRGLGSGVCALHMKANLEIIRGLVWIFIKGGRKTAMQTASKKSICKCFCMKLNYPNYRYIVGGAGQPTCMKETFVCYAPDTFNNFQENGATRKILQIWKKNWVVLLHTETFAEILYVGSISASKIYLG